MVGTALIATDESFAHDYHKQRLIGARAADTTLTTAYHINWPPGAPVRVLRSAVTSGARGEADPARPDVIGEEEGRPIFLFSTDSPLRSMSGEFDAMALYAGTGVGRIATIEPAAARIGKLIADAEALLESTAGGNEPREASSPVCYAGEFGGAYMGMMEPAELADALQRMAEDMRQLVRERLEELANPAEANAPPFESGVYPLAGLALAIGQSGAALAPAAPRRRAPRSEPPPRPQGTRRAALLDQLGTLIPRVPEGAARGLLVEARRFLESQTQGFVPVPAGLMGRRGE
jgi:nitronate monooxygenase